MIVHARIDNRLLHGIVAYQWSSTIDAKRMMIINDDVANDSLKKDSLKLAKPTGYALSIITLEKAIQNFNNNKYGDQSIFLITDNVDVIISLLDSGVKIKELNVGATQGKQEKNLITSRLTLTDYELNEYKKIGNLIPTYSQYLPSDKKIEIK